MNLAGVQKKKMRILLWYRVICLTESSVLGQDLRSTINKHKLSWNIDIVELGELRWVFYIIPGNFGHPLGPILLYLYMMMYLLGLMMYLVLLNGWQLAKMKKSIPDMSLSWNL